MKIALTLLFVICKVVSLYQSAWFLAEKSNSSALVEVHATLDNHLMYLVITAGILSVFKLRKNPG